ncbi:MAG: hypothetical protein K2J85_00150 [Anaeroplasmataceae bacterium]|nr:hypothetical protein [Anaeroplasmataceae bacterium]
MRKKEKRYIIENSDKIPLVGGKIEWNVYDVANSILHHSNDIGTHPALVLIEIDGKVLVAELNHTSGPMKLEIKNPNSLDPQKISFLKRKTIVSKDKHNRKPLTIKDLKAKRNDRILSEEEKEIILKSLNGKTVNRLNIKILLELEVEEKKPKK